MKKAFRIISLILAGILLLSFCACDTKTPSGDKPNDNENDTPDDNNNNTNPPDNENPDDNQDNGGENPPPAEETDDFYTLENTDSAKTESCIPNFTDKQKSNQKLKGVQLINEIHEAAADLSQTSYTIKPGDYGFDMDKSAGGPFPYGVRLLNIKRPDDNPFTIIADGVTFWLEPTGYPSASASYALLVENCENVKIKGLTLDEYTPNDVEGKVTEIDFVNNRISISLTNSSMAVTAENIPTILSGAQCRIVPYKPNGDFIASLYRVSSEWGPGSMQIKAIDSTGTEGEYWLTFKSQELLKAISASGWVENYGSHGTLEVGDTVSLLYGNVLMSLVNCKQITLEGVNNHMTKGMPGEEGGYGAHVWKDCYFGPRPGSSKVMTAGEYMIQATRHGTTLDNVTIMSSSDDQINLHGFWGHLNSVNAKSGNFAYVQMGLLKGDIAIFYDAEGKKLGEREIAEDVNNGSFNARNIKFTQAIPADWKGATVRFPALECDGWTIKNCNFYNNYQSIITSSGSGVFENNKVFNMGLCFGLSTNSKDLYEGGQMGHIIFRNNIFYNCATTPGTSMFYITQSANFGGNIKAQHIEIVDNLFVNCGKLTGGPTNCEKVTIKGNIFVDPLYTKRPKDDGEGNLVSTKVDIKVFGDLYGEGNCEDLSAIDNILYAIGADGSTDEGGNKSLSIDRELADRIAFYVRYKNADNAEIIEVVKANIK